MNRPLALLQINCALRFLFIRFLEGNNGSVLFLDAHVVKGGGKLLTDFAEVDFVELVEVFAEQDFVELFLDELHLQEPYNWLIA